jgi:hypothetical protein
LNFLDRSSKNIQISNFVKIRPFGAEFFNADRPTDRQKNDRQTDMTMLIATFPIAMHQAGLKVMPSLASEHRVQFHSWGSLREICKENVAVDQAFSHDTFDFSPARTIPPLLRAHGLHGLVH